MFPALPVPSALLPIRTESLAPSPVPDRVTGLVIAAFFAVHRELGFGFIEGVYQRALTMELLQRGLAFEQDVPISVYYRGTKIGHYRAPIVVAGQLVVEIRAGVRPDPNDERQLTNCVRASGCDAGLLLFFGPAAVFRHVDRGAPSQPQAAWPSQRPGPA